MSTNFNIFLPLSIQKIGDFCILRIFKEYGGKMAFFGLFRSTNATEFDKANNFSRGLNEEQFCLLFLENILYKIIDDAINPIELSQQDKLDESLIQLGAPYIHNEDLLERENILEQSKTLREICIRSVYSPVIIFKCEIGGVHYFFTREYGFFNQKNKTLQIGLKEYPVLEAYEVFKPFIQKEVLFFPIKSLYNFYKQIELYNSRANAVFFKKNNLNAETSGMSPSVFDEFIEDSKKVYRGFLSGNGGIIDAKDSFEVLTPNIADLTNAINFTYTELARILGIPQAELLGESPTGLNSSGIVQYQTMSYDKRLKDYRKRIIEPILKGLNIDYIISGLTIEEKIEVLNEFGTNGYNLESSDKDLFYFQKYLIMELLNANTEEISRIRKELEPLDNTGVDNLPDDKSGEDTREQLPNHPNPVEGDN